MSSSEKLQQLSRRLFLTRGATLGGAAAAVALGTTPVLADWDDNGDDCGDDNRSIVKILQFYAAKQGDRIWLRKSSVVRWADSASAILIVPPVNVNFTPSTDGEITRILYLYTKNMLGIEERNSDILIPVDGYYSCDVLRQSDGSFRAQLTNLANRSVARPEAVLFETFETEILADDYYTGGSAGCGPNGCFAYAALLCCDSGGCRKIEICLTLPT